MRARHCGVDLDFGGFLRHGLIIECVMRFANSSSLRAFSHLKLGSKLTHFGKEVCGGAHAVSQQPFLP